MADLGLQVCSETCALSCTLPSGDNETTEDQRSECRAYTKLFQALFDYFGHCTFRDGQMESLLPLLHGKDVFAQMATGAGKSLCIFLGPLCSGRDAIGIVISPLTGLIEEQIAVLRRIDVAAVHITEEVPVSVLECGHRFVFMSPEVAISKHGRSVIQKLRKKITVVAIDEAHCIHEWGKNFRPAYDKIGGLRALTKAPFICLTATAPPEIRSEISERLHLEQPVLVLRNLDRRNIFYSVSTKSGMENDLRSLASGLRSAKCPQDFPKTIIFCQTKEITSKIYTYLSCYQKDRIGMYHASLTKETRQHVYKLYCDPGSQLRCVIATIAFGMGLDIPDIQLVIIYGVPETIAQFSQLSGRAGRSGLPSIAHTFYSSKAKAIKEKTKVGQFCTLPTKQCLRRYLLKELGSDEAELPEAALCCNNCSNGDIPYTQISDILKKSKQTRTKKRQPLREINQSLKKDLEKRLKDERCKIKGEVEGFHFLGDELICPENSIHEICQKATWIESKEDVKSTHGVRPEFVERFYNVVVDVTSTAPPPSKRARGHTKRRK